MLRARHFVVILSQSGTEVGVMALGPRGLDAESASVVTLPERCVAVVPWSPAAATATGGAAAAAATAAAATAAAGDAPENTAQPGAWVFLIATTGSVLVLSADKCRVFARVPDSSSDSVVCSCAYWRSARVLCSGRDDGAVAVWNVRAPQHAAGSSPVLTKGAEDSRFETGRASFAACRGDSAEGAGGVSGWAPLVFASDDGEVMIARQPQSQPQRLAGFAGIPHDVDVRAVECIWPMAGGATGSGPPAPTTTVSVGVLMKDGRVFALAAESDSDSSDMFDVVSERVVSSASSADSQQRVSASCMLQIAPASRPRRHGSGGGGGGGGSQGCLILVAVSGGCVVMMDADTGATVTELQGPTRGAAVTHLAASWPFVVAVDAAGCVKIWELLMF